MNKLYRIGITYSSIMAIIGLTAGVVYREYTKYALSGIDYEKQLIVSNTLSLAHGHFFLMGVLLPLAMLGGAYLVIGRAGDKTLYWSMIIYMIGAAGASALLFYKGLAIIYLYSLHPGYDLTTINEMLFMGSKALRESLYGVLHLLLGVGLTIYMVRLARLSFRVKAWNR